MEVAGIRERSLQQVISYIVSFFIFTTFSLGHEDLRAVFLLFNLSLFFSFFNFGLVVISVLSLTEDARLRITHLDSADGCESIRL